MLVVLVSYQNITQKREEKKESRKIMRNEMMVTRAS